MVLQSYLSYMQVQNNPVSRASCFHNTPWGAGVAETPGLEPGKERTPPRYDIKNVLAVSNNFRSLAFDDACIFVPSSVLNSKYPVFLLPKTKHSILFQRTLSYL